MTSRAGNWLIAIGATLMFFAACCVPAALGPKGDPSMTAVAASLFAVGALAVSGGIYLRAQALIKEHAAENEAARARRARGGCELCASDVPVIHCRVHQLQLCATCLAAHYDVRSCSYVPPSRRPAKSLNRLAKAHGA
ncbi:MAG TPA: hypothetical protein VJQ82_28270 [Terriglobales bacterium]|nr:hypothetical protein [Terriglobales bacterium]